VRPLAWAAPIVKLLPSVDAVVRRMEHVEDLVISTPWVQGMRSSQERAMNRPSTAIRFVMLFSEQDS